MEAFRTKVTYHMCTVWRTALKVAVIKTDSNLPCRIQIRQTKFTKMWIGDEKVIFCHYIRTNVQ